MTLTKELRQKAKAEAQALIDAITKTRKNQVKKVGSTQS